MDKVPVTNTEANADMRFANKDYIPWQWRRVKDGWARVSICNRPRAKTPVHYPPSLINNR
jgi:hypothetical protein